MGLHLCRLALGGTGGASGLVAVVDIHGVLLHGLAFDELLILELVLTLSLDVDTAIIRHLVLLDVTGGLLVAVLAIFFDTAHLGVFAICGLLVAVRLAIGNRLGRVGILSLLLLAFLGAVLFVVGGQICLGLLGGELGRRRGLAVPVRGKVSLSILPSMSDNNSW